MPILYILLTLCIGLQISTSDIVFVVGETASISCATDLDVMLIEWLYNHNVVASSTEQQLDLIFSPVNDSVHNRDYSCRVTSPYGIQEDSIRITAQSKQFTLFMY